MPISDPPIHITSFHVKFIEHIIFLFFCFLVSLMFLFDFISFLFFRKKSSHKSDLNILRRKKIFFVCQKYWINYNIPWSNLWGEFITDMKFGQPCPSLIPRSNPTSLATLCFFDFLAFQGTKK